jgi:hypothetical protein
MPPRLVVKRSPERRRLQVTLEQGRPKYTHTLGSFERRLGVINQCRGPSGSVDLNQGLDE